MNILLLSNWFPYPPDNGSKIRAFHLLKHLAARHRIAMITFSDDPQGDELHRHVLERYCCQVHIVPRIQFQPTRWRAIRGFISLKPRFFVDTHNSTLYRLLPQVLGEDDFDLVLALEYEMAYYAAKVVDQVKVLEGLEVTPQRDQFLRQRSVYGRMRYGLNWWKFKRAIGQLVSCFDAYTSVSEQENQNIQTMLPIATSKPNAIVPNGVDLSLMEQDYGPPEPNSLVFSGALTFYANLHAMEFFLSRVYPSVRARYPNVILRITGRTEGVPLDQLPAAEGVIFTGYLDDVRPCIAQSWMSIVPLTEGGGTRLKILEALALGTPVVSTSKGAEGLDVTPGEDILIADEPAEFADAVIRLLTDERLRARMVIKGRQLVEERYSWAMCAQGLEQLLYQVEESRRG